MASICLRAKSQQAFHHVVMLHDQRLGIMQVRRWRVRAPLLQLPFLFSCQAAPALISCTKESLPREKEREQELQRTGKNVKKASTKNTNPCKDCFQKHSKGRERKWTGCGSLSSALKPALALLNIFKPLWTVCAIDSLTKGSTTAGYIQHLNLWHSCLTPGSENLTAFSSRVQLFKTSGTAPVGQSKQDS